MAHYQNVTRSEMEPFLLVRGFQPMEIPGTFELVYGKVMHHRLNHLHNEIPISLRVYTGIGVDGQSRAPGKDAIRLCLYVRDRGGKPKLIGLQKRVHRVYGWRKNLEARINNWEELLGPACPKCGLIMVLRTARKNKKNQFWGCQDWPACNGTREVAKPHEDVEDVF